MKPKKVGRAMLKNVTASRKSRNH